MKRAASLLPLLAGLVLGFAAGWSAQQLRARLAASAAPTPGAAAAPTTSTVGSARPGATPTLVLPPLLDETEADAALAAYLALPPLPKDAPDDEFQPRLERLNALLTLLPDSRFPRLLDTLAARLGHPEGRLRRAALNIWAERDAEAAARWALALVPGDALNAQTRASYVTHAALAWARDDFAAAYAWTGALDDKALRDGLLPRLLAQLAATDPGQAVELAHGGDETFVRAARRAVFEAWAGRDPAAALRELGPALLQERDRPWSVSQAMMKWVAKDPSAAVDWAATQPVPDGEFHRGPLSNIAWNLGEQNPEAMRPVLEAIVRREDMPHRARLLQDLFGPWAREDPAAALAWLDTLPDGAQRSDLIGHALNYAAIGRADDFLTLARRLPASPERDERIALHLSTWVKKDPDAALDWLAKHDDPEFAGAVGKVEGALLAGLAATDPDAALARWRSVPDDRKRLEFAAPLASAWARSDPAAATRWFGEQLAAAPPNDPRTANSYWRLQEVAAGWIARDPLGYFEWTRTLPAGPARSHAENTLNSASLYSQYNDNPVAPPPRAAFAGQLALIPDASLRERALTTHLVAWLRADVRSARAWIESGDALSPEAAAKLLTRPDVNAP